MNKRKLRTRVPVAGVDPDHWRIMLDMKPQNPFSEAKGVPREVWEAHQDAVLAEWTRLHPGTRPSCWWAFSPPQELVAGCKGTEVWAYAAQRQRLGGTGEPAWLHLRLVPRFDKGVPAQWIDRQAAFQEKDRRFIAASVDPSDPPIFESEAAYLARLQLFVEGERPRTGKRAFDPAPISLGLPKK